MLPAVALLVVIACAAASATRLRFALTPTAFDMPTLLHALPKAADKIALLRAAAVQDGDADWELGLLDALSASPRVRVALVNEQLRELDHRVARWARVPRVCASICTSAGLLLATVALRIGLTAPSETVDGQSLVHAAILDAMDVAAIGLAGAACCIAIQMRSRRAAASRAEAVDRLVDRLEPSEDATRPGRRGEGTGGVGRAAPHEPPNPSIA